MKLSFQMQKYLCLAGLILLLAADISMAAYSIHIAVATRSPQQQLADEQAQLKLLRADINRARDIQRGMPVANADCDRFEKSLLPLGNGYSAISAELTDDARSSGVLLDSVGFVPKDLNAWRMSEVEVNVSVAGPYRNVVRFLNSLQRSPNYYVVESLSLASGQNVRGPAGSLRVALRMKSYFVARRG